MPCELLTSRMQDLIGLYILKGATVKEDRTKRIFDFFDKDKNGVIDKVCSAFLLCSDFLELTFCSLS